MLTGKKLSELGVLRPGLADEIQGVMDTLGLCAAGREFVRKAVEAPSRRVQSGIKNVSGMYPSQKVGLGIGYESRTSEHVEILDAEWDPSTLAYFDQAPYITLRYKSASGRGRAYQQRPDFVRIYSDRIALRECKTETWLLQRASEEPALFYRDAKGVWRCPPGEAAAAELGLEYEIATDVSSSPTRTRNFKVFLEYTGASDKFWNEAANDAITIALAQHKRLTVEELLEAVNGKATIDDVHRSIAFSQISFDIDQDWIGDHARCPLFSDAATRDAYKAMERSTAKASIWMTANTMELKAGKNLDWDGRTWSIANIGSSAVVLLDGGIVQQLPRKVFDELIRDGSIRASEGGALETDSKAVACYKMIQAASPADLRIALNDLEVIQPFLNGTANVSTNRTVRRKISHWRKAEASLGNGFVGLFPRFFQCGNRSPRLDSAVMAIVKEQTNLHYSNPKKVRRIRVYERIAYACSEGGHQAPSYGWYCSYLKRRPSYDLLVAREGRRAAYTLEPRAEHSEARVSLRADYSFQKGYCDHTQVDDLTRCSVTSKVLGKPWLTLIVDDHSADVIGQYLSYDPPSYRSVLMALRDCVARHGRLPESLVVDGGKEFSSIWFEATCAYFRITIIRRPPAKARFGSRGERMFGTANSTFFHALSGNTQLRKFIRQITPEVDPAQFAIWTFESLLDVLEQYFEEYRNLEHREILVSPLEARTRSVQKMGSRPERRVVYDADFLICTCPTTDRGVAKVQPDGVKINYLYYSSPELRLHVGKKVPVRFEPFNMAIAYAMVGGKWVTLRSRFHGELWGRSERELRVAREEYKKRRGDVEKLRLNEKTFVKFLLTLDETEGMLIEHHRTLEMRRAIGEVDERPSSEKIGPPLGDVIPDTSTSASVLHCRQKFFDLSDSQLPDCEAT